MTDYIIREEAIRWFQNDIYGAYVCGVLKGLAPADVQPVRHGRWDTTRPEAPMFGYYYCSECGRKKTSPQDHYCPNCGADMRGEDE